MAESTTDATHDPLPDGLVEALLAAPAYPLDRDATGGIEHIQTHLSHVFLLSNQVYKLRKPADLGFVSFAARSRRNADCLSEVRLNRRLAPSVYLGIAAITESAARFTVGPLMPDPKRLDPALEHLVVMVRLDAEREALSLLERGELDSRRLSYVADKIARFHRSLPSITTEGAGDVTAPAEANLSAIEATAESVVKRVDATALRRDTESRLAELEPVFDRRRVDGRVVEGHGDLHLQHVFFPSNGDASKDNHSDSDSDVDVDAEDPPIIDCLEFSESLRVIDVAAEVAFLAMDLAYRGAGDLAEGFIGRYALETDDYDLYTVIDFFVSHRAAVRAKVAALAAADEGIADAQRQAAATSAGRHVALARRALAPRPPGDLVLVGGVIGTGKSSVAHALASHAHAVVVSTDRVRKSMLGLDVTDRLDASEDAGAYAPEARGRVYDAMIERAEAILRSGRTAVLDATWSKRAEREKARRLAATLGSRCVWVETRCETEALRSRLEARQARNDDASDAGPELLEASIAGFEPIEDEFDAVSVIDTSREAASERVAAMTAALGIDPSTPWD